MRYAQFAQIPQPGAAAPFAQAIPGRLRLDVQPVGQPLADFVKAFADSPVADLRLIERQAVRQQAAAECAVEAWLSPPSGPASP